MLTATWKISNLHVGKRYSPRGGETFPPKFHLIPPKFHFSPTWRISFSHVEIYDSSRGDGTKSSSFVHQVWLSQLDRLNLST